MRIIELEISNFMNVKAVTIRPGDASVIRIEGKNRQGKSNVIDSIWAALGGKSAIPESPLRDGTDKGHVRVDLGDLTVERRFNAAGNTYLDVTGDVPDGSTPQALLSSLYSTVSLDAGAFISMSPAARSDWLLTALGLSDQVRALDAQRSEYYTLRRDAGRTAKTLKARLGTEPVPDAPRVRRDVSEITDRLRAEMARDRDRGVLENDVRRARENVERNGRLRESLAREMAELETRISDCEADGQALRSELAMATATLDVFPPTDTDSVQAEIDELAEWNRLADKEEATVTLKEDLDAELTLVDAYTSLIEGVDADRAALVATVDTGVPGLEIGPDGAIVIGGRPYDSMSTSEMLTVAMRIGMASDPRLRVIRVSRGESFDRATLADVESWADENDVQVWIERVVDEPRGGFYIENGEVKR